MTGSRCASGSASRVKTFHQLDTIAASAVLPLVVVGKIREELLRQARALDLEEIGQSPRLGLGHDAVVPVADITAQKERPQVRRDGVEARLINSAGKIKLKGGFIDVTGTETSLSNKVFKSDKSISVKRGSRITVNVPGAGSEAFSCADTFEMEGGHVEVVSADDCVGAETNVVITGGKFYGYSLQNDVFDTNAGDITVDGGLVLAYTTAQEPTDNPSKTVGSFGFDVNGYTVNINGGTVVAIGGDNLKGNHMPSLAGTQNLFVDEEVASSKYSGKYLSLQVGGTNTTLDFAGAAEDAFDTSKRAGLRIVKVGGINRFAMLTANGVVTNMDFAASAGASSQVQMVLDGANNTVTYTVGRMQLGTYPRKAKQAGVSTVGFTGATDVNSLFGTHYFKGLDSNLAKVAGVEYATVEDAIAANRGQIELLWDSSWNPAFGGDYTIATNGFVLAIGGELAYRVTDNRDGTLTVSVKGGAAPEAPEAASVTIVGTSVRVGVADVKANLWYALEKTTDLTKPFTVDSTTWASGAQILAGDKELVIALGGTDKQAFYRVVVSTTAP